MKVRTKTEVTIRVENTREGFMQLLDKWNTLEDSDEWEMSNVQLAYVNEKYYLEVDLEREINE